MSSLFPCRRGYATERQKGLLLVEKLDYIQSKLLRGIFFIISKPLGKLGSWINEVILCFWNLCLSRGWNVCLFMCRTSLYAYYIGTDAFFVSWFCCHLYGEWSHMVFTTILFLSKYGQERVVCVQIIIFFVVVQGGVLKWSH